MGGGARLAHSGPDNRHYRLDPVAGEVQFGPEVRHADGELRQYGAVPPLGSRLVMTAYRVGGGRRGNVARGVVRVLKSSVPYVTQVENRHPASGGVDGETMDNAKLRGPLELRASGRAVTADDFEVLARDVAPDAARVACLPATTTGAAPAGTAALPGAVRLLVVPRVVTDDWAGSRSTTCAPRRGSCCGGSATTWTSDGSSAPAWSSNRRSTRA